MHGHQKILIKDPYLNSTFKSQARNNQSFSKLQIPRQSYQHHTPIHDLGANYKYGRASVGTKFGQGVNTGIGSGYQFKVDSKHNNPIYNLDNPQTDPQIIHELQKTQNQFQRMARAYSQQNKLNKKILNYQAANNQYHEALKLRNLDLNNKLTEATSHTHLLYNKFENENMRAFHEKDLLLRKYQSQSNQLLQARKTISNLLQLKTRLEQQLNHMTFLLEKQSQKFNLQIKQHTIRMQGLQRTIKNMSETKDKQITQLRHKLQIYQDQNKRLTSQNRSLYISSTHPNFNQNQGNAHNQGNPHHAHGSYNKQNKGGLDNLSQINYTNMDSHHKMEEQKLINDKLQRQIQELKKKLFKNQKNQQNANFQNRQNNSPGRNQNQKNNQNNRNNLNNKNNKNQESLQSNDKIEGIIKSIYSLRNGINKQVFDVFFKSVKDGQKHRSNSLVIFLQNWKNVNLQRIEPYITSYFQSRNNLKQLCESQRYKGKPINQKIQQCLPYHLAQKGRNQINLWILSTIQLAKNQREASKKTLNNLLLFLFRLLTIQYRIRYPMQGKSYVVDKDIENQLQHEIVKAIQYILEFS